VLVDAQDDDGAELDRLAPEAPVGGRVPLERAAAAWVRRAIEVLVRGRVVLVDYAETTAALAALPPADWLRTYRDHVRRGSPLDAPGEQDVTCEVAVDQLHPAPHVNRTQAEFLAANGVDELVATARAGWKERAHVGDLEALRSRSRVGEGAAITDLAGLGSFRVLEWVI
jgi:SAM-dependent MidA family methyltransferase